MRLLIRLRSYLGYYLIRRTIVTRAKDTIPRLYKTLVRPQLEYCIQVWSPCLQTGYGKTGESAKESHKNDSGLQVFKLRGNVDKVWANTRENDEPRRLNRSL